MNSNRHSFPNGFEKTDVRWEKIKIKLAPNVSSVYEVNFANTKLTMKCKQGI